MEVQLVVSGGNKAGQVIPIVGPKFIIGRADDCHLKPRSELISRYHCAIISEDGYVAVRDLGSKNGIFLNGERVPLESELKNGDKLSVGPLEFVVNLSVGMKAPKKPKIESVEQAVVRTVERETATKAAEETGGALNIADWLLANGEGDQEMETQTATASKGPSAGYYVPEPVEAPVPSPEEEEEKKKEDSSKFAKPKAANSRDAAANLLKSFFKGGR
ncbi:MAG: FHA domain-containing protein [Thermoguttaceae bacterium]